MNLTDPGELKVLLERHGLTPQKRWGQHFLRSPAVVKSIVDRVQSYRGILEVGPGPGVLTQPLSVTAEKLVAIEIDPVAISALSETAPSATVRLVDVLEADLPSILEELPTPRALVSNMPYNITGPLLTAFAEAKEHFDVAVLMMQKEVGERVLAQPGTRECGSLSIAMQAQFNIEKVCNAPGGAFFPPPKVDSVVLQFTPVPLGLDRSQAGSFFKLVRSGFVQPRKTLLNNLLASGWSKHSAEEALRALGLALNIRPHQLGLEEWKRLSLYPLS